MSFLAFNCLATRQSHAVSFATEFSELADHSLVMRGRGCLLYLKGYASAFASQEFFAVSWHFMRPHNSLARPLLRGCAVVAALASVLGHGPLASHSGSKSKVAGWFSLEVSCF